MNDKTKNSIVYTGVGLGLIGILALAIGCGKDSKENFFLQYPMKTISQTSYVEVSPEQARAIMTSQQQPSMESSASATAGCQQRPIAEGYAKFQGQSMSPAKFPFYSNPKFEANISPRNSGGVGIRSITQLRPTDYANQAVPRNPVSYNSREDFREPYASTCTKQFQGDCKLPQADYAQGNYNQKIADLQGEAGLQASSAGQSARLGTIITETGDEKNVLMIDRLVYSTSSGGSSRFSGQSDLIRGDLPVQPNCDSAGSMWSTSAARQPATALRQGMLNILGDADTTAKMYQLVNANSGYTTSIVGGVPVDQLSAKQQTTLGIGNPVTSGKQVMLSQSSGDIGVNGASMPALHTQRTAISF
jgi:hypothetical protein